MNVYLNKVNFSTCDNYKSSGVLTCDDPEVSGSNRRVQIVVFHRWKKSDSYFQYQAGGKFHAEVQIKNKQRK